MRAPAPGEVPAGPSDAGAGSSDDSAPIAGPGTAPAVPAGQQRPVRSPEAAEVARTARRLGWQTAGVVLASVLLLVAVVLGMVVRGQHRDAAAKLDQAAYTIDDTRDVPSDLWVTVVSTMDGTVTSSADLPPGLPDVAALTAVAQQGGERRSTVSADGGTVDVLTVARDRVIVQVAVDPQGQHDELERLLTALAFAGGTGVVLAGLAGAWLGRRAVRPLAAALARQRRFVADASHELRTPLTLLSTRVQLLGRHLDADLPDLPPRVRADVTGLHGDSAALAALFDDLLLAADDRRVPPEPVDVAAIAGTVVAAAAASAAGRGIVLRATGDASAVALAGPVSVRRALTALVDNALDHATGVVEVDVARNGDLVRARVTDDGPGIAPGTRVFERFASDRPAGDGRRHYGLGLALVAEIAAQHGGRVSAGARDDHRRGAQVTLELPANR